MITPQRPLSRILSLPFLAAVVTTTLLAGACDGAEPSPPSAATAAVQAPMPATQSDDVLAIVGGEEVTLEDLRGIIGEQLSQMDFEYRSERHRVIDTAMRRYVRDQLLEAEAEERGITVDALLDEVVGDQVAVSDDDVRLFYLQRQSQLQGRTFESIAPQIRQFLESQQRDSLIEEFTDSVAEKHGARLLLEPFRVDIDISNAPVLGAQDAPITLIEFSDFECPYCESFVPTLEQVKEEYGDQVKIAFRHFPLRQIHPNAQVAAEASMCAYDQGKFWEAHDLYFAEQDSLGADDLREKAERLGLDTEVFEECLESGKYVDLIDDDVADGIAVGVTGTPAIFVNGRPLPAGAVPFEMVAELIDDELERIGR